MQHAIIHAYQLYDEVGMEVQHVYQQEYWCIYFMYYMESSVYHYRYIPLALLNMMGMLVSLGPRLSL